MQNFVSAPHRGEPRGASTGAPNAALLIDFDNVTMGIRSDLTRQMKDLLSSDIIRGKVAVQRAYADWRRYAQYIVPLSEASVDLIFAPAYGSSKKNATDIRLAIDALELVFTRPEIGTFILLSGDSDFSSLVLKLKEYGKYVIGVGLRESASDLLVQNCDEYFSYSALTGLTKAGEEDTVSAIDPWDLVERSVGQMASDNDVMRSDRLKQVMLDMDPNFDEAEIGYSKFNKFLTEAASRNKLALKKLGNGQYEVQPLTSGAKAAGAASTDSSESRSSRGGRRDESRGRGRKRPEPPKEIRTEEKPSRAPAAGEPSGGAARPKPEPQTRERREEDVQHGYDLLKRAIRELIEGAGDAARDSDIKRKMLELESGWDEAELGFTKFSRFLRQAHDAEVIDLQRTSEGYYEARLPSGSGSGPGPERGRRDRTERGSREAAPKQEAPKQEAPKQEAPKQEAPKQEAPKQEAPKQEAPKQEAAPAEKPAAREPARAEEKKAQQASTGAPASPKYGRRDRRGKVSDGPPPLLPGQAVGGAGNGAAGGGSEAAKKSEPETKADVKPKSSPKPSQESAGAPKAKSKPEAKPKSEPEPKQAEPAVPAPQTRGGSAPDAQRKVEADQAPKVAVGAPEFDPDEIGLPTEAGAVIRYLSNSYQGVGQKTAEALIETFGADRVFNGLNQHPEKVREVLGSGRRTEILLEAWERDHRRRTTAGAGDKQPTG